MAEPWVPVLIGPCRVCGWKSLITGGLCVDCREAQEWCRANRAFCALVHRQSPARQSGREAAS